MSEFIKRVPWGLITFFLQAILIVGLWLHTLSVKAAVDETLKSYATKAYIQEKERAHADWAGQVLEKLDERYSESNRRLDSIETKVDSLLRRQR